MVKQYLLIFLFFLCCLGVFSQGKKKVLLVGIDGLQFEQIAKINTPNFDQFNLKRGFTGGLFGTSSQQATSSGPGWTTILTGVWVDEHKVSSNSAHQISHSKSIFSYLKKLKTASISTWKNINLLLYKDMYSVDFSSQGGGDDSSLNLAVQQIENYDADFVFIHLDDIDYAGHDFGFGDQYNKAVQKIDNKLGTLLNSINKSNDDWLVLLVTDHGRDIEGRGHGKQSIREKTIFIGMNKKGGKYFNSIDNSKSVSSIKELELNSIPQTTIVATILKHLEIPFKQEWKINKTSLID